MIGDLCPSASSFRAKLLEESSSSSAADAEALFLYFSQALQIESQLGVKPRTDEASFILQARESWQSSQSTLVHTRTLDQSRLSHTLGFFPCSLSLPQSIDLSHHSCSKCKCVFFLPHFCRGSDDTLATLKAETREREREEEENREDRK